jgi:hypothetical protein
LNFSISLIFAFVFYELYFVVAPVVLKLLIGKKVPFNFHLTQNNGESTLRVDSVTREGKYQATISASGDYAERGSSIATGAKIGL